MKLYLAFKTAITLMEGESEQVLGVFDSEKAAWSYIETTSDFEHSEPGIGNNRVYHFDGELSYYWYVQEVELNKPIYEYA